MELSELIAYPDHTGVFSNRAVSNNSDYLPGNVLTKDTHSYSAQRIIDEMRSFFGSKTGHDEADQVSEFIDKRTGARDIAMQNSGFIIYRNVYTNHGNLLIRTTKVGADTSAKGISSKAGACNASLLQVVTALAPGDPLVVTTQPPTTVTAGVPFGLIVTAENGDGSTNTSFQDNVSVFSADGNSLGGTLTVAAVNGVATFSGLTETTAGLDALIASTTTLPEVETNLLTVAAAAATKLAVSAPSSSVAANSPFSLQVQAEDPFGNVDLTFSGSVTLAMGTNPSGAALGGTLTVAAASGVASFSDLTVSKVGVGYTLQATSPGLTAGTSSAF